MKTTIALILVCLGVFSCMGYKPVHPVISNTVIVQATAEIQISYKNARFIDDNTSHQIDIDVINNPVSTMTVEPIPQKIFTPNSQTAIVSIGIIKLTDLFDNNLRVCNGKCKTAGFRAYLTGYTGLENSIDATEILPIYVVPQGGANTLITENSPGITLQTISIGVFQTNVKLSSFVPAPSYELKVDLTNAGTGEFSANIVLEYYVAL